MPYTPDQVLFLPTTDCNLNCPHCTSRKAKTVLSKALAVNFLRDCAKNNIKRVGFTGGEPFLVQDFMLAVVREAVRLDMYFDRIMTNAVWYKTEEEMKVALARLYEAGYDGSICVSVDAFHAQPLEKVTLFIKTAAEIFARKDVIAIATVDADPGNCASLRGPKARSNLSISKLKDLAGLLSARPVGLTSTHPRITSKDLFIKISKIALSPVGRARHLKDPWDGKWFREDYCKGPGNVFLVMPNGDVKPCCGYASDLDRLTIGNISRDTAKTLIKNARKDPFISTVFTKGLTYIRKQMEADAKKTGGSDSALFPGKTSNNCFFCHHILTT